MTAYLLHTLLFQLLFLLVYDLFLQKETFFTANRMYLLFTVAASFLLPLIQIEVLNFFPAEEQLTSVSSLWRPEFFDVPAREAIPITALAEPQPQSLQPNWWLLAYGAGFLTALAILFRKINSLRKLFSYPVINKQKDFHLVEIPNSTLACTFIRTIFLGAKFSEAEKLQILPHELIHVKQKHSLDLLFFELLRLLFWFNPLIYLYQRRITSVHEFQADAAVVKQLPRQPYYEQLLNQAFSTTNISFINQFFNHSLIKKRILMLQRSKSNAVAKFKYLAVLPLLLAMLTYVSCTDEPSPQNTPEVNEVNILTTTEVKFSNNLKGEFHNPNSVKSSDSYSSNEHLREADHVDATDNNSEQDASEDVANQLNVVYGSIFTKCENEPQQSLKGVNITIKGTSSRTISDEEGAYSISPVRPGDVVVFSYQEKIIGEYHIKQNGTCDADTVFCYTILPDIVLACDPSSAI